MISLETASECSFKKLLQGVNILEGHMFVKPNFVNQKMPSFQ